MSGGFRERPGLFTYGWLYYMELGLFTYCWLLDEGAGFIQFLLAFLEIRFIHSLLAVLKGVRFIHFGSFEGTRINSFIVDCFERSDLFIYCWQF